MKIPVAEILNRGLQSQASLMLDSLSHDSPQHRREIASEWSKRGENSKESEVRDRLPTKTPIPLGSNRPGSQTDSTPKLLQGARSVMNNFYGDISATVWNEAPATA